MDHRSHNKISKLKDTQGNQFNTHKEIESALVQHFQSITKEPLIDRSQFIKDFTKHIPILVTREDNYNLNRPVTEEEVSKVIKEMLKPLLPTLVSEEQTGYVEGRQILNNTIQAHEVVHSLKSNKQVGMIIQLDLAKAYDKLSWAYIKEVLITYGFDHNWIRCVMALVTTSIFSILLNGSPSKTFKPSRGLRQGDLLSPFLFIVMMECLGNAIKSIKAEGKIQGLKLTLNGDALTHQQFVDDTMLQGTPTIKEALAFKKILNDFAMVVGKEVSLTKSKIFFFNIDIAI
eukprot:PITA_26177